MIELSVFFDQLHDFYKHRIDRVPCCGEALNFQLLTHRNRLDSHGYWIDLTTSSRSALNHNFHREDAKYTSIFSSDQIKYTKTFVKNQQGILRVKGDKIRHVTEIDLKHKDYSEDSLINCPNCGSASLISELRGGCNNCGTSFEITDLFPSIYNYYFVNDYFVSEEDGKSQVGRIFKAYSRVFQLAADAGSSFSMLSVIGNSQKLYEDFMKNYSPDFLFSIFTSQAINMLNILLFSDNPSELPFVKVVFNNTLIPQLIDFDFKGFGIFNKQISIENNILKVTTICFADSYYDVDGQLKRREDKYITTFCRDMSKSINYGFTFSAINCPTCGAAFNALKNSVCPYCANKYHYSSEDWYIIDFRRE